MLVAGSVPIIGDFSILATFPIWTISHKHLQLVKNISKVSPASPTNIDVTENLFQLIKIMLALSLND